MAVVTFDAYAAPLVNLDSAAPRTMDEGPIMGGKVRFKVMEYTSTALVAGKRIEMGRLPKGCRILPESCVITEDMGSSVTLSIGYNQTVGATSGDATFAAATASSSLGTKIPFVTTVTTAGLAVGDALAQDTSFHLLTAGATLTAAKRIKMFLYYVPVID